MTNQKFRAALFDMDDTLIDRRAAYDDVYKVFYDLHDEINSSTSWEDALEFFWSLSPDNATNANTAIFDIQKRWPGVPGDSKSHYNFYFSNMVKFMKVLPGAVDFMNWMNSNKVTWGIVTNGDQFQHDKAATEVFMEAVRLLDIDGLKPEEILFVGDNPYTDIIGAHGVGMKTAWVRMGREKSPDDAPDPDYIIDHVEELKDLLV